MSEEHKIHIPVLGDEVIKFLAFEKGDMVLDATAGFGGHAALIMPHIGELGRYVGIDQDAHALAHVTQKFSDTPVFSCLRGNFRDVATLVKDMGGEIGTGIKKFNRMLADIGVSSYQLDTPERGFSFQYDGPLDMRMNNEKGKTAAEVLNGQSEEMLADIFYYYGEERRSRSIAKAICEERRIKPFRSTKDLADFMCKRHRGGFARIHPATKIFQALRIAVNQELDSLKSFLDDALSLLAPGGRLGIITFHSLEDRIVKQRFRTAATGSRDEREFDIVTKKPVIPTEEETKANPRARSAKLRVIAKTFNCEKGKC